MRKILNKNFFDKSAIKIAKELLGKFLVRKIGKKEINAMIIETEAYDGFVDKASHAYKGKTKRNEIMFGEAGYFYIYLIYGMYNMLNIVTDKTNYPSAVLIRAVLYEGKNINGPGKLTKILKIDKKFNKKEANKKTGLWIEDRGIKIKNNTNWQIKKTPRIGVQYAGECAKKLYRFVLEEK